MTTDELRALAKRIEDEADEIRDEGAEAAADYAEALAKLFTRVADYPLYPEPTSLGEALADRKILLARVRALAEAAERALGERDGKDSQAS